MIDFNKWEVAKPENVTEKELSAIDMIRINKTETRIEVKKEFSIGRLEIKFTWASRKNLWGRFGGGWNWKLGFEAGSWRCVALLLLICRLYFYLPRKEKNQ